MHASVRESIVFLMHDSRIALALVVSTLLVAGCAASSSSPGTQAADEKCVVSIEPGMKMVTLAAPSGLEGGVTSLFFATMPEVHPGDLVRIDNRPGNGGPRLDRLEPHAHACSDVAQTASDHHKHHQ